MTLIRTCDLGCVGELDKIRNFQFFIKFTNVKIVSVDRGILKIGVPVKFEAHSSLQHVTSTQGSVTSIRHFDTSHLQKSSI